MGLVQQPSGLAGPIALEQRLNHAVVSHIRNARDQDSTGSKPTPHPTYKVLWFTEVLQHVGTNNGVKVIGPKGELHYLNVSNEDAIEASLGFLGSELICLKPDDLSCLPCFESLTKSP
jgi:hypothetical protein